MFYFVCLYEFVIEQLGQNAVLLRKTRTRSKKETKVVSIIVFSYAKAMYRRPHIEIGIVGLNRIVDNRIKVCSFCLFVGFYVLCACRNCRSVIFTCSGSNLMLKNIA